MPLHRPMQIGTPPKSPRRNNLSTSACKRNRRESTRQRCSFYRVDFSVHNIGRYISTTKRKIVWRFVLIRSGPLDARFLKQREDHKIELVWSIKSGKRSLYWNNQDITHFFPRPNLGKTPPTTVHFAWQTSTGVQFVLIANSTPQIGMHQYEFVIEGISFYALPRIEQFDSSQSDMDVPHDDDFHVRSDRDAGSLSDDVLAGEMPTPVSTSADNSANASLDGRDEYPSHAQEQHKRLELNGFKTPKPRYEFDLKSLKDELRSDLYSPKLDILRGEVAAAVPETEEMVSRAIINAFSEDHDSDLSNDSVSESTQNSHLNAAEVEADVLAATLEWFGSESHGSDTHERRLTMMQKHVEAMVSNVRHDRLETRTASNIMLRAASLLQLQVSRELPRDTVILKGLGSLTTAQDITDALSSFGDVEASAISKNHEGFGLCRFVSEESAESACRAAKRGSINVDGRVPEIFELQSYSAPETNNDPSSRHSNEHFASDEEDDFDTCNKRRHMIDISGADGIEASINPYTLSPLSRVSLPRMSHMRGSFGSSVSSAQASAGQLPSPPCYPRTFKTSTSSSTLSTAPYFLDDSEASAGSAYKLSRSVHDEQFANEMRFE